jgi:two-component system cell cycle sensor histidine kinase/response regulator CckA
VRSRTRATERIESESFPDHSPPGRRERRPRKVAGAAPVAGVEEGGKGGMSGESNQSAGSAPVIDRADRISGIGWLIVLACGFVVAAVGLTLLGQDQAEPFVLGLLGILSIIGIFTLFARALGILHFSGKAAGHPLAKAFVDNLGEGVVITDRDGRIVYANRAYADLTGARGQKEVRSVERAFAPDATAAEVVYRLAQALREGSEAVEEIRMPGPIAPTSDASANRPRWYRVRVKPLSLGQSARNDLAAWIVSDVTAERKRQESAYLELQHAIDYLDHAPAGFLSAEPDGRIVHMNATLAEWLGIDLARFHMGQMTLAELVGRDGVALLAAVPAGQSSAHPAIIDLDFVKKNGQSLPVRLLHSVPLAPDGAPGATRTIVLNRSPGEDVSEALRAAEVRFARFFNNTPIAIASVDREGRIRQTNAPFARLFGPGEPGRVRRLADVVRESDRVALSSVLGMAAEGKGEIPPIEATLDGSERDERFARFYVTAVDAAENDPEAAIVYALETTEHRRLETQVKQQQKMDSVGQLAGGVAHDFNNVLTAIIGFSDLLLTNHKPSDPSFQDIMNIKQNANRAASLVRQLLAFSRRQTLRPQILNLADLLSDLSILLQRLLGENVKLEMVHGRDLWPVKADLNQLEQVIINLAVNARDAMPSGGKLSIRTRNVSAADIHAFNHRPLPETDCVMIEVEDTGTGIPPEARDRIFEPFFSTKEVGKGTGLGLSTVYGIVKQTGGHIFFDSIVGKGTVFRIFIPRHAQQEEVPVAASGGEKAAEIADLTGTASILLVEDEEAVRAFAARALQTRGYTVHSAASGVEALEVMKQVGGKVDLVVSDVVMPEMDGPTLLRELRKDRPDLKIIFVSGYAEDAFAKNLPEGEEFQFLPKPFSLKQLATAVKETLGR